ncbi:hypothetical protein pb186bvf_019497 [Paramecium bursaria]
MDNCEFCQIKGLQQVLQQSLSYRYAQSQNYHYTKSVNEVIGNLRTSNTIRHRDLVMWDTEEELLNKEYTTCSAWDKLRMLGEYYKYHNDIPRMFMLPAVVSLNYYHDKKRRIEYYRIARMIDEENRNNPDKPPKGIVGDSPIIVESEQVSVDPNSSILEVSNRTRILDGIFVEKEKEKPYQFINFKQQLQQYQNAVKQPQNPNMEKYINESKGQHFVDQIREQIQQMVKQRKDIMKTATLQKKKSEPKIDSARLKSDRQNFQRKSSLTNILSMLKTSTQKKKNQSIKSDQKNITPREQDLKSPQNSSQHKIACLLKSQKCFTPRTQQTNQSPHVMPKKIQQLEIKVMSDLQNLLNKKISRDSKHTLHLESVSINQDPRSLTQRITPNHHSEIAHKITTQIGRKKLNIREMNQFRNLAQRIQEPLSSREPRKLNGKSKSNDKFFKRQINTSGEQKFQYYQQAHSARQPPSISQSNPSQSTFAPNSQSSVQNSINVKHQKSATQVHQRLKQEGILKSKLTLDSQLYKAALNIASVTSTKSVKTQKQKTNFSATINIRK